MDTEKHTLEHNNRSNLHQTSATWEMIKNILISCI